MMRQWWVYMVECVDGSLYTGITTDPARRLDEHNGKRGGGARYTRARQPVTLVYKEPHPNRSSALCREFEVKKLPRTRKLELLKNFSD
ncbi:MAG: GIY-YIG nuclease family protein [bacterium]